MYQANSQEYYVTMKKDGVLYYAAIDDEDMARIINAGEYEILNEKPLPKRVDGMEVYA